MEHFDTSSYLIFAIIVLAITLTIIYQIILHSVRDANKPTNEKLDSILKELQELNSKTK